LISGHSTPRRNHQTLNAILQLHQRCRCATLKNGFLDSRCFALLRTASLGMTMMRHPFGGRVACPRERGHVLAMQGGIRCPMATLCVAMPPNGFVGPLLTVIPTGGPKARSGGTRLNSASTRHPTPGRSMLTHGGDVDLQALNAMTQPTRRSTPSRNYISGVAARR